MGILAALLARLRVEAIGAVREANDDEDDEDAKSVEVEEEEKEVGDAAR